MTILQSGVIPASGGYEISRSLRFNPADSAYLNRTFGSGDQQKFTLNLWVKRSESGARSIFTCGASGSSYVQFRFNSGDTLYLVSENPSLVMQLETTQVFRDYSAWYMITLAVDTTQATPSNTVKLYVNGSQVTAFSTATYPLQNTNLLINSNIAHYLGTVSYSTGTNLYGGYFTEVNFVGAQQLTPSSFGQTNASTGVWEPIKYTGTYGTNGFYLNFSDNSNTTSTTLGKDSSGNGNNWTPIGFSVASGVGNDSLVDTPTSYGTDTGVGGEVRGNYCTLNPLIPAAAGVTLSDGNLRYTNTSGGANQWYTTIIGLSDASYYEATCTTRGASDQYNYVGDGNALYATNGQIYIGGSLVTTVAAYTSGDVIGVAFGGAGGSGLRFFKNGAQVYSASASGGNTPIVNGYNSCVWDMNFGQRPFAHTAPSGFRSICTQNLPPVTIGATSTTQANDYFNVVLWTGNDATRTITGYGFQPDFIWTKGINVAAGHRLSDAVRGASGGTMLNLNTASTGAENTDTAITGFASDGFTMDGSNHPNVSPYTYVGWGWNAGGSNATNTSGTITSTVRANTTAGFSIVKFVTNVAVGGTWTTGHGLGVVPAMVIYKRTNSADSWLVYHGSISTPQNNYLTLNTTNAVSASSGIFNGMTTSLLGSTNSFVQNGDTLIAYCFAAVAGYSAFGSYTGNGSTDGPFIYTGFRPRWLLVKQSSSSGVNWRLLDTARDPYNVVGLGLTANTSDAETSGDTFCDILSNGFKVRQSTAAMNTSSATYIYAAFAESPFKYSLAR